LSPLNYFGISEPLYIVHWLRHLDINYQSLTT